MLLCNCMKPAINVNLLYNNQLFISISTQSTDSKHIFNEDIILIILGVMGSKFLWTWIVKCLSLQQLWFDGIPNNTTSLRALKLRTNPTSTSLYDSPKICSKSFPNYLCYEIETLWLLVSTHKNNCKKIKFNNRIASYDT